MCNLYEYDMMPEVMQLKEISAWSVLASRRPAGPQRPQMVYPNSEAPVIRSLATPAGVVRDIAPMRWAPAEEAMKLQKPAPDDDIVLLPEKAA